MKKTTPIYTLLFSLFSLLSFGQNTFPATGNVGIGTLTPGYSLDIAGSINATQVFMNGSAMESSPWSTAGNTVFYNTGNVGIGTDTPGFTLDINGTVNATGILLNGAALPSSPWDAAGNNISYTAGNVGIGTTNTQGYLLAVAGSMVTEGVKVELEGNWPDFVFEPSYDLPSLSHIEKYIQSNGHLPDIPSAEDVAENGIELGEMNAKLLQKIEELTLHTIQQQKELDSLKTINGKLIEQNRLIKALSERLEKIEQSNN